MLKSTSRTDDTEFLLTKDPDHIAKVWAEMEQQIPVYWEKFVKGCRPEEDDVKILGTKVKSDKKVETEGEILTRVFDEAIADFEESAGIYRDFFDEEATEEYEEDPNSFKTRMSRELPVIARTLRQPNKELKEWQKKFRIARPADLLAVFSNVLDFYEEWKQSHSTTHYLEYDTPEDYELSPINDDDDLNIPGVIGMGIKTIVLFHQDPERMPKLGRHALFGLYFLSNRKPFGMVSDSSEFLMINDESTTANGSFVMDQNYWYPYDVFSVYLMRIYRWIEQQAADKQFLIDKQRRYVYVEKFLESICSEHVDDMKTMRAHDSFGIPA